MRLRSSPPSSALGTTSLPIDDDVVIALSDSLALDNAAISAAMSTVESSSELVIARFGL